MAESEEKTKPEPVKFGDRRAVKSNAAFRTISEVAEELDIKQHVLRFWETKFNYIKPMKRGGGRRYYRPEDVDLLVCIRDLLYQDGYTIKGVKKLLRDAGGKPEKIREGLTQSTVGPQGEAEGLPVETAPVSPARDINGDSFSVRSKEELNAILEELVQLKGKLDGALESFPHRDQNIS